MDYEVIVDQRATKLDAIWSGLGPYSQRFVARSSILFQFDKNISKLLLARDLTADCWPEFISCYLFNKKSSNKKVAQALKLFNKVKIPDWKIKEEILTAKKKEVYKIISENCEKIDSIFEKIMGHRINCVKIYLSYSADKGYGLGGCCLPITEPTIILRVSNSSKILDCSLIAHELMHAAIKNTKKHDLLKKLDHGVEEALFDLLCTLFYDHNKDYKQIISQEIANRDGQHKKYITEIYKMIKPILNGKEDLVWKYINWEKLKKIK